MNKALILLAGISVFVATPSFASDKADVMAIVNQFADVFGAADAKPALAACADPALILDDIPPYVWQGRGACARWQKELAAYVEHNGISGAKGTLQQPWHVDVVADKAYVVVPIVFSYTLGGKAVTEPPSVMTAALSRSASGWRIVSWSMAAH